MWTKIKSIEDINKIKLNARVLKFTGIGTPLDPPPIGDTAYTLYSLVKNTGGTLDLKVSGTNPLFASLVTVNPDLFKTASQIIAEGKWWF